MIRKIILLILLIAPSVLWAQQNQYEGSPNVLRTNKGGILVDSFAQVAPVRDTSGWFGRHSDFIRQGGDLKYWNGSQYVSIAGDSSEITWQDTLIAIATKPDLKNYVPTNAFINTGTPTIGTFFGDVDTIRTTANFYVNYSSLNRPSGMSYGGTASMIYQKDYHNGSMIIIGRGSDDEFFFKRIEQNVSGPWFRVASREYINSLGLATDSMVIKYSDTLTEVATHTYIHNSTIQSASVTGTATKTLKLTRGNNTFISTTFTDKDNQTLSYASGSKTLSISGGNSVILPIDYGELQQTITGQTSPVFTLSQPINTSKHLTIIMNTAVIYPEDYSITAANQITLSFAPSAGDKFLFYYKEN